MNQNERSSSSYGGPSSAPLRPTITLPPRSSMENLFNGSTAASPGPMTLVSNFFSQNDPDSDCRSFSQLLAGGMSPPAEISGNMPRFPATAEDSSTMGRESGGGLDADFQLRLNRPSGLVIGQLPMFTIPTGLSPASLLDSPRFFPPAQGPLRNSRQQALAQNTAQAAQAHSQMHIQAEYPSLSAAPSASFRQTPPFSSNSITQHHMVPPPIPDHNIMRESSDLSHFDQRSQLSSFTVDKPADDGYNWRKYGQKQVKGSEYPRSYYKCTHLDCQVKKKVERSLEGQITEIIYKGQHNHQPPLPNKRTKDSGNPNGTSILPGNPELGSEGQAGNLNKLNEGISAYSLSMRDQEYNQATPEQFSGSSNDEEGGDADTRVDERNEDEPEAKRRNTEARVVESASSHRGVTEPRIIVQTTSEVDLLDDGYRWRKYGQKVVKGNPYPRSYYKCTNAGCNVRKHVERAPSDPKAVITTYEGKHTHDVPAAKNSSHNTANNAALPLNPRNAVTDHHASIRITEFAKNDQQPIAVLQFKEEQMT